VRFHELVVANQSFIEVRDERSFPFEEYPFDGILGLGLPTLAIEGTLPLFDTITRQGLLDRNLFSYYLSPEGDEPSSILFGGVDSSLHFGSLLWVPLHPSCYWEMIVTDITLDGQSIGACPADGCRVAVDSGTSLFTGPPEHIRQLTATLRRSLGTGCTLSALPTLGFTVAGHALSLEPADYVLHAVDSAPRQCALAFMALDVPPPRGPLWVFGDVFMRKYYTVFDRDNNRMGFALSRHGRPAGRVAPRAVRGGPEGVASAPPAAEQVERNADVQSRTIMEVPPRPSVVRGGAHASLLPFRAPYLK